MHIPTECTQNLKIQSFEEALKNAGKRGDYDCSKWLYVPDYYTEYRYILGTKGRNPLICIGINPSTAAPDDLDNTLKSVSRIAEGNGFDSWTMFNVYAQRATRPDDMDDACNRELHLENMKAFEYVLSQVESGKQPTIWAAWGAIVEKRDYLMDCIRDMTVLGSNYNACWVRAGRISKAGHPHHPLYLRKDERIEPFDIAGYLSVGKR